jgi:hypothetical protein
MSSKRPLHPFHLVTPSPWPMFASFAAFNYDCRWCNVYAYL